MFHKGFKELGFKKASKKASMKASKNTSKKSDFGVIPKKTNFEYLFPNDLFQPFPVND